MKSWRWKWGAAVLLVAVGGAGYRWMHAPRATGGELGVTAGSRGASPGAQGAGAAARPIGVELAVVARQTVADEVHAVGTVRARQSVMIRAEVPGRVAALGFRDGQAVRRGAPLVQLDDSLQAADLAQAQAQVAVAQANAARTRELVAARFLSQQALDTSNAALQVALAQRDQAQARLARMVVRAPFDGVVGIGQVTVGDYVKDGADLVALEDQAARVVDFRVPEREGARVRVGQAVQVRLDAQPQTIWSGRVEVVEPQVEATARALLVRAALRPATRPADGLRSGQFARVAVTLAAPTQALMVPEQALLAQGDSQWVVKAVPAGAGGAPGVRWVSQRQAVRLGLRRDGWVQVIDGLAEGDRVVVAGHQRLSKDGTPLRDVADQAGRSGKGASGDPASQSGVRGKDGAPAMPKASAPGAH